MDLESLRGSTEVLRVTARHDVYPFIDPKVHYDAQTLAGRVVLITGASRGIGLEPALHFARAGASLTIVARKQKALAAGRDTILRERPSVQVLIFPADVRDVKKAEDAVTATVAHFGRLDLVANAASLRTPLQPFASEDPAKWWEVMEVNIRGTYNFIHFAVPELQKTKGRIVMLSSLAAQHRIPFIAPFQRQRSRKDNSIVLVTTPATSTEPASLLRIAVSSAASWASSSPPPPPPCRDPLLLPPGLRRNTTTTTTTTLCGMSASVCGSSFLSGLSSLGLSSPKFFQFGSAGSSVPKIQHVIQSSGQLLPVWLLTTQTAPTRTLTQ
ncbi:hypothetical protein DFH94DRAFT_817280 [Russula ochroleuca]|uniref:NAD(P)-binding protein n=1 Tax=Russula ochroleuca TaxID=152965 RepID=A0A9P5MNL1_9AGAM|nr:hypothetical protein DFH94DRAFT_817280 [Russula ochroleuca]